jgi:hypothetical protein
VTHSFIVVLTSSTVDTSRSASMLNVIVLCTFGLNLEDGNGNLKNKDTMTKICSRALDQRYRSYPPRARACSVRFFTGKDKKSDQRSINGTVYEIKQMPRPRVLY